MINGRSSKPELSDRIFRQSEVEVSSIYKTAGEQSVYPHAGP